MELNDWLETAIADASRRGLTDLRPLLETLAKATRALREADWNDDPRAETDRRSARDRSSDRPQA